MATVPRCRAERFKCEGQRGTDSMVSCQSRPKSRWDCSGCKVRYASVKQLLVGCQLVAPPHAPPWHGVTVPMELLVCRVVPSSRLKTHSQGSVSKAGRVAPQSRSAFRPILVRCPGNLAAADRAMPKAPRVAPANSVSFRSVASSESAYSHKLSVPLRIWREVDHGRTELR